MRNVVLIILCVLPFIAGCTPAQQYLIGSQLKDVETNTLSIIDARPDSEKRAEILSLMVTSDNYGIFRIGDGQLTPDRISFLSNALNEQAVEQFSGKTITLKHFEIFNNQQKALKKTAGYSAFGVAGAVAFAGVADDADAYIEVNLEFSVDDTTFAAKSVTGYRIDKWSGISDDQVATHIQTTMLDAVAKAISK